MRGIKDFERHATAQPSDDGEESGYKSILFADSAVRSIPE
jgi:hypothetical protein